MLNRPEMYLGIKTGTTDAAGPCLASLVSIGGREFIIIVLNCRSSKWRYKDTEQLR
jgi:D-alanyl-D-alanine carboxypeptidase